MGMFDDAKRLPSAKFPTIGTEITGTIRKLETTSQPEFDAKGRPSGIKFDDDGHEVTQVDVTLDTADGILVMHTGGGIFWAIGRALAADELEDLEVGDILTVVYTGDAEPTAKGRNGAKQYTAEIVKGSVDAPAPKSAKAAAPAVA